MSLKDSAVFALVPVVYGFQKLYTVIPNSSSGDCTFSRGTTSSRINNGGLVETTPAHFPTVRYKMVDAEIVGCPEQSIQMGRINVVTYNELFDSNWTFSNCTRVEDSTIEKPTGQFTAVRVMEGTSGTNDKKMTQTVTTVSGRKYCMSIYVKPYNTDSSKNPFDQAIRLKFGTKSCNFDAQTGWSNDTTDDPQVQRLPNNWLRVSCIFEATSTSTSVEYWLSKSTGSSFTNNYTGDTDRGLILYGAQVESNPGSNANEVSSLIPTGSTTVTRSKDSVYRTSFFSSYIQEPYCIYWEGTIDRMTSGTCPLAVYGSSGTGVVFGFYLTNRATINVLSKGSGTSEVLTSYDFRKFRGDYIKVLAQFISTTEVSLTVNGSNLGVKTHSATSNNTAMTNIAVGYKGYSDNQQRQSCGQALIFPRRFTDSEAIEVTTSDNFDTTIKEYKFLKA